MEIIFANITDILVKYTLHKEVLVFWVLAPWRWGQAVHRNVGIQPLHYAAQQPRKSRIPSSPPWKPQMLQTVSQILVLLHLAWMLFLLEYSQSREIMVWFPGRQFIRDPWADYEYVCATKHIGQCLQSTVWGSCFKCFHRSHACEHSFTN